MVLEELTTQQVQKNDGSDLKLYDIPHYSSFIVGKLDEVCKWCGAISEKGDQFCIDCGTALIKPEIQTAKCPVCETRVEETDKFCVNCGASIKSKQKQVYYCHICVSEVQPDDEFCVNCGSVLFNTIKTPTVNKIPATPIKQKKPEIIAKNDEIIPVYKGIKPEANISPELQQSNEIERIIPVYSKLPKSDTRVNVNENDLSGKNGDFGQASEQKMVFSNNGNCPRCGAKIINEQYCLDCLVLFRRY